jgi:cell division protein FtsB
MGSFLRLSGLLLALALLWLLFAPGVGGLAWWSKRAELRQLQEETAQLARDNAQLEADIERLQNDPAFLEEVARREHQLLRKNEQVFDFSSPSAKE